jgi:hypothetical protein
MEPERLTSGDFCVTTPPAWRHSNAYRSTETAVSLPVA